MGPVKLKETRMRLSAIIRAAEQGESVAITRRGNIVARLSGRGKSNLEEGAQPCGISRIAEGHGKAPVTTRHRGLLQCAILMVYIEISVLIAYTGPDAQPVGPVRIRKAEGPATTRSARSIHSALGLKKRMKEMDEEWARQILLPSGWIAPTELQDRAH